MLAHLYAAHALLQMSRISEATVHLDPSNANEGAFGDASDTVDDPGQESILLNSHFCRKTFFWTIFHPQILEQIFT
jgi:hypothetical protein